MPTVVFVAPFAFEITLRFAEAAARHPGARMVLISQDPPARFPERMRGRLAAHLQVENALDPADLLEAVRAVQSKSRVLRLLGTLEQLQVPLAVVREKAGIPGMGAEVATRFRDKALMKEVLREAGLACARHQLLESVDDARAFVRSVGFPLVVKPPAGAGAKGTYQVTDVGELEQVLMAHRPHPQRPLLAEEFIQGEEYSFDGVLVDGQPAWHSLTHYLPTALDAVRNPWIQWCVLLPRELDHPRYDDIREAAQASVRALGLETGVYHMEWFRRPDGTVAISEVGARPGGAQISRLMSYAHEFDFYRAWARVAIDGTFDPPSRRYATGAAFLRGQGRGRVKAIHGLGQAQKEIGDLVVETNLPRLGQPKSSSYEGEGFVVLRHPDTEVVKKALYRLISLVHVELG
ncbi:MAG: ATP-grasp domain-containing protein [Holophagales bacterium]|nr:ATP-grasp domain-containing protein [Holophagales bacterium]